MASVRKNNMFVVIVFFPCNQLIGGGEVSWRQITEIDNQHHLPFAIQPNASQIVVFIAQV